MSFVCGLLLVQSEHIFVRVDGLQRCYCAEATHSYTQQLYKCTKRCQNNCGSY